MTSLRTRCWDLLAQPGAPGSAPRRTGPLKDAAGGMLLWTGLSMPAIFGLSGLGHDVTLWYMEYRVLQTVADTAVLAAAHAAALGGDEGEIEAAALASAAENEFVPGAADIFQVNAPPQSGPNTGDPDSVEIVIARPADLYFSSLFLDAPFPIRVRAAAGRVTSGTHCIVALDETMDSAAEFTGTADATMNCGVASNSNSMKALHIGGTATLTADPAQAFGDIFIEGSAELISEHPPQPRSPRVIDPYGVDGRNVQLPEPSACVPSPSFSGPPGSAFTVDPGRYCGDFLVENKDVTFNPGTYVIEDGSLTFKAHSTVNGSGVTFILTGSTLDSIGTIEITSAAEVTLTAPSAGDYAGILFYVDRDAESFNAGELIENQILGGASTHLKGAVYAPSREILFTGGATGTGSCLQLIGRKVTITGNAVINNDTAACGSLGIEPVDQTRVRLLE